MHYRLLGKSSLKSSVVGIGALHFGVFVNALGVEQIIHRAIDLGINLIDSAPQYGQGQAENFINKAICGRRSKVFLTSKVGLRPIKDAQGRFGVETVPLTAQIIRQTIENSLRALGTDYIDLFQIHAFDEETSFEETLKTLDDLVKEGKARTVGCCNLEHSELLAAFQVNRSHGWPGFVSCQMHYNLIERRAEDQIIPVCQELEITPIAYRALCRGILTGQYKVNEPVPQESRAATSYRVARWLEPQTLSVIEALENFAAARGYSMVQLSLAWLLSRIPKAMAVVGVRNLEQLESCVKATQWLLDDQDLKEVDAIIDEFGLTAQVRQRPETFLEK